jgi:hypothetical protein
VALYFGRDDENMEQSPPAATTIPHKTRQHNNTKNRHPGNKKEDKFVLKKQLTQMNVANNRRIRRKDAWSTTATVSKLNTVYDTFKFKKL